MKKALLLYYTGTFNTRYLTYKLKDRLEKLEYEVDTYQIDPLNTEKLDYTKYDLLGLGYPIYGFNAPWPFLKFILKQKFPKGLKTFIYKNSGETFHANDASSVNVRRKLNRCGAKLENEYHFIMPYNIHFRYDDHLVKEMLGIDELLMDNMVKEVTENIPNIKRYKFIPRLITFFVKLQFIGGDVNSFFYKIDKNKCSKCGLCVKQCPTKNIHFDNKNNIKFKHHCLMCMRCSLYCPKDAITTGLFASWKVNGPYNFNKIEKLENKEPIITEDTKGFFRCYIETYKNVKNRHKELFGE